MVLAFGWHVASTPNGLHCVDPPPNRSLTHHGHDMLPARLAPCLPLDSAISQCSFASASAFALIVLAFLYFKVEGTPNTAPVEVEVAATSIGGAPTKETVDAQEHDRRELKKIAVQQVRTKRGRGDDIPRTTAKITAATTTASIALVSIPTIP
jgi:hypothetical protein